MKIQKRINKHYMVKLTREELDLIGAMTKKFIKNAPPTVTIISTINIARNMSAEIYRTLSKDPQWKVATAKVNRKIAYDKSQELL